ncbi:hypothetical protein D3C80_2121590 [compost metagenome]
MASVVTVAIRTLLWLDTFSTAPGTGAPFKAEVTVPCSVAGRGCSSTFSTTPVLAAMDTAMVWGRNSGLERERV